MQVWSKSIHLFRRYRVGKPNMISFHGLVTLKMRSRSPKSNQLFPPSQPCIYASLVKIHPLVQKNIASERSYADADTDGIRTKNNMSPTFSWGNIMNCLSQQATHRTILHCQVTPVILEVQLSQARCIGWLGASEPKSWTVVFFSTSYEM